MERERIREICQQLELQSMFMPKWRWNNLVAELRKLAEKLNIPLNEELLA